MDSTDDHLMFENWGIHINRAGYARSFPPAPPDWLNPAQKQDWSARGLVIWDARIKRVTHLYAVYALQILQEMNAKNDWKTDGITVGVPAYEISFEIRRGRRKKEAAEPLPEKSNGKWILADQIGLSPLEAQDLYRFLNSYEAKLQQIALVENEDQQKRLAQICEILFKDGMNEVVEKPALPKIAPISIPAGDYLTVAQIAEHCGKTPKKINSWIEKEKIAFLDLPHTGRLVRIEDVNILLSKLGLPAL
jgi:hypothetical protein